MGILLIFFIEMIEMKVLHIDFLFHQKVFSLKLVQRHLLQEQKEFIF